MVVEKIKGMPGVTPLNTQSSKISRDPDFSVLSDLLFDEIEEKTGISIDDVIMSPGSVDLKEYYVDKMSSPKSNYSLLSGDVFPPEFLGSVERISGGSQPQDSILRNPVLPKKTSQTTINFPTGTITKNGKIYASQKELDKLSDNEWKKVEKRLSLPDRSEGIPPGYYAVDVTGYSPIVNGIAY
jgi:hypothetical protein